MSLTLRVVGSAAGVPQLGNPCSSYLVRAGDDLLVLDAGPGSGATLLGEEPSAIFISHAHPDHLVDAAILAYHYSRTGRVVPLIAPAEVMRILTIIQPLCADAFAFTPLTPVIDHILVGRLTLDFCRTDHGLVESYAVRVTSSEGTALVYTGDCRLTRPLIDFCQNADLVLAESTWIEPNDAPGVHMTARDAGQLAEQSLARLLMLTHLDSFTNASEARQRASQECRVPVEVALPGTLLTVATRAE